MANELKIPHTAVSAFYMLLQSAVFTGYLVFYAYRWWYFATVVALLCAGYGLFMKRYFHLHLNK